MFYNSILILAEGNMLLCPRCQPTIYKFFYFKIEIKTKVDLYMPCEAMAHTPSILEKNQLRAVSATYIASYIPFYNSAQSKGHDSNCVPQFYNVHFILHRIT